MGPTLRPSRLDRHGAELLALQRAGATVAQLTRWLRFRRDTVVAATTVGRWLENAPARGFRRINVTGDFDAAATLNRQRACDRELRFPRLAVSCIDEHGYHVLRLRTEGASIGDCHRALRDGPGLRVARSTVSRWLRRHRNG